MISFQYKSYLHNRGKPLTAARALKKHNINRFNYIKNYYHFITTVKIYKKKPTCLVKNKFEVIRSPLFSTQINTLIRE